jgi:cysteinyl-tRNA synthetase
MSTKYLGETFDIHGGGMDLKFPHHECEIAQNVASCNHAGAKYWLHTNMLNFNGQKMSKSLGNSILPMEFATGNHPLLDKGYAPSVVRFLFLQSHYSSELDINIKGLQDAEKGLKYLMEAKEAVDSWQLSVDSNMTNIKLTNNIEQLVASCKEFMDDDFNTAKTIANLFEISSIINSIKGGQIKANEVSNESILLMKKTLQDYLFDVFGLQNENTAAANNKLDDALQVLINLRKEAKAKKDWAASDAIRNQLAKKGIQLKDEKDGSVSWSLN